MVHSKTYKTQEHTPNAKTIFICVALCCFVLVFFSPFSIANTSLGDERANLSAFRTFFFDLRLFVFVFYLFL